MLGMRTVALATVVLAVCLGLNSKAEATVFHPAPDPIQINDKTYDWSTTPGYTPANSWYSSKANEDVWTYPGFVDS